MTEIFFPLNPRPREDPAASGVVQENLESVMQLFQKGVEDGDIMVWDKLLGRYRAVSSGGIETVTALPLVDLYPGREAILTDNPVAPSYLWHLRYNPDSPSIYKWEYMGGSPAISVVSAWQGTFSTAPVDIGTMGPDFQIPAGIGGDFLLRWGAHFRQATFGREARMSPSFAGIVTGLQDACISTVNDFMSASTERRFINISSGALIRMKYYTSNSADEASFRERWLSVQPYRLG